MQEYFKSEEAAKAALAATPGATLEKLETKSFQLPQEFYTLLRESSENFAVFVRRHADNNYEGCVGSAWDDALEGGVRGVKADLADIIDAQWRRECASVSWMVSTPEAPETPKVCREWENYDNENWRTEE
jgi:hypothetical protein